MNKSPVKCKEYEKYKEKLKYPATGQMKLDGMRCVATVKNHECILTSSTGKPIEGVPHIQAALQGLKDCVLDGELYFHGFTLQDITSRCRRLSNNLHEDYKRIEFHVFEVLEIEDEVVRVVSNYIKKVKNYNLTCPGDIEALLKMALNDGYEGIIIRGADYKFQWGKRLNTILKYKPVDDAEYKIVQVNEGVGKLTGRLGSFTCECNDRTFNASFSTTEERKKELWERRDELIGKMLTVEHLRARTKDGMPREPRGKEIRDYE